LDITNYLSVKENYSLVIVIQSVFNLDQRIFVPGMAVQTGLNASRCANILYTTCVSLKARRKTSEPKWHAFHSAYCELSIYPKYN